MSKNFRTIFLVTNNYKPYCGGVARSIDTLCDTLKKNGDHVYIITLDFLGNQSESEKHVIRVPCIARWRYKKNFMALPLFHNAYLTRIAKKLKPDIIHVHHPFLLGISGLRIARLLRIPIVFTYHTQYEHYLHYIPVLPPWLTHVFVETMVNQFCQEVDGIIVPSSTIKEQLMDRSINTRMQVIPSPIDPLFFMHTEEKKRGDTMSLLCVSRFAQEKNIEFLGRVMSHLDPQRYVLSLVGYGFYEEHLKKYMYETLGLSKKCIKFIIKPSRERLTTLYRQADLFIFSSITETQGMVLAEAMASGLPVIAVDAPGARDCIQQGRNGFLVNSEQEMVERIRSLGKNTALYEDLQNNALKSANTYHPETIAAQVGAFYDEFI